MATRRPSKHHVERIIRHSGPLTPLVVTRTSTARLQISIGDSSWTAEQFIASSQRAMYSCFQCTRVHPDRILYISTGLLFTAESPLPFGGPKTCPGYTQYTGSTTDHLFNYIVSSAYKSYWGYRGRTTLEFALDLHHIGDKEKLDELLLKGMKRCGHVDWNKGIVIPERLMHVPEASNSFAVSQVLFTPTQLATKTKLENNGDRI
ncbi:hypothetical protein BDR26DRAFT_874157 [Obelidium mucronatum]|nr:hypothetical protein BDR26DRAFT_874157 [Obelidium mucronatum]